MKFLWMKMSSSQINAYKTIFCISFTNPIHFTRIPYCRFIAVAMPVLVMLWKLWIYFSGFKKDIYVFSLLLVLILLSYSSTLLFSYDEPQIETTLPFAYQIQGWTQQNQQLYDSSLPPCFFLPEPHIPSLSG